MNQFNVKDKVIVITGATGVLGGSVAEAMAKAGGKVVVVGRSEEKVKQKVGQLSQWSAESAGFQCDVMDKASLVQLKEHIVARFGTIDVLVNAAGGNVPGATQTIDQTVFDLSIDAIDDAMDLNTRGTLYPSLILGQVIAENGKGSIINISSMAAYGAITRVMGYTISKSGINGFTQWLACEMAQKFGDKVRVNAIAPGFFIGEQNRKLLINEDGSLTDRSKKVIAKTPMGRFGNIDELNGAVQFLCSDAASFITGVVLPIDGGFSAFSGV